MPTVANLAAPHSQCPIRWLAAISLMTLAGCVSVRIEAGSGEVRTIEHLGMLRIELANPRQAISGSVAGVGLVGAPLGWSLGYTRQRWALMGSGCRAVVWLAPGGLNELTRTELARAAGVCLIDEDAATTSPSVASNEGIP